MVYKRILKHIASIALIGLVYLVLPVQQVYAADPNVTITLSAWVVSSPSGFTLTYISDYEVQIDWIKGLGSENTMIRACIGRPPENITDGIEVYYGDGTTTNSFINMEMLSEPVYYRAWGETALGIWSPLYAEDQIEGLTMLLAILIATALTFTITSTIFKKGFLAYAGAAVWIITAISCFDRALDYWDTYYCLGFLCIGLMLADIFAPAAYRETTPDNETPEEPDMLEVMQERQRFLRERKPYTRYGR